jgi:hypothetical protein
MAHHLVMTNGSYRVETGDQTVAAEHDPNPAVVEYFVQTSRYSGHKVRLLVERGDTVDVYKEQFVWGPKGYARINFHERLVIS